MKDAATLLALAERYEAAMPWTAQNSPLYHKLREMDLELARLLRWHSGQSRGYGDRYGVPAYNHSIDAAMTAVPDGWDFGVASFGEDGSECHVWQHGWKDDTNVTNKQTCATPALALTAAALRAHAAIAGEE